jgi:hypothetical protein
VNVAPSRRSRRRGAEVDAIGPADRRHLVVERALASGSWLLATATCRPMNSASAFATSAIAQALDCVRKLTNGVNFVDNRHRNGDIETIFEFHDYVHDRRRVDGKIPGDVRVS